MPRAFFSSGVRKDRRASSVFMARLTKSLTSSPLALQIVLRSWMSFGCILIPIWFGIVVHGLLVVSFKYKNRYCLFSRKSKQSLFRRCVNGTHIV